MTIIKETPQYAFVTDKRYIDILKQYQTALREAVSDYKAQYMPNKREANVQTNIEKLSGLLEKFIEDFTNEKNKIMQDVQARYSQPVSKTYVDPQVEMLRRQDFKAWLSNLSDGDLYVYVQTQSQNQDQIESFERSTILNEMRSRIDIATPQIKDEYEHFLNNGFFAIALDRYKDDPQWQKASLSLANIQMIRPQGEATTLHVINPDNTDDQGPFEFVGFESLSTAASLGGVPDIQNLDSLLTKCIMFVSRM